jgi:alkanesulfonate monooxygenase SsuD/methylene tetrahydromethanopterin reductase-like flavin-dependent oxidoreductase (luciferase family)
MDIGIGLPNTILETPGERFIEWSRRAEERGFATLATIGRIAYPGHDELITFATAAGGTGRIGLLPNILLAPAYPTGLLAKQTATLARVSGGRLTLGVGVGARPDDFAATGAAFEGRGRIFDQQLEALHAVWRGDPLPGLDVRVAPPAPGGAVPLLFAGDVRFSAPRAVRWNGGLTIGGAPPEGAATAAAEFRRRYTELGGAGTPRVVALHYFSLGEEHTEESLHNLRTYYGYLSDWAETIAQGASRTERALQASVRAFEEAGIDELILDPTVPHLDQVDRAADVVLG